MLSLNQNYKNGFSLEPSKKHVIFSDQKWYDFISANFKCTIKWNKGEKPAAFIDKKTCGFDFFLSAIDCVFKKDKDSPYNDIIHAERAVLQAESKRSHIILCQKVDKTKDNEHGLIHVDSIPIDKPAVLFLGGVAASTNRAANGTMSIIRDFFKENNFTDAVDIYSVIYEYNEDMHINFNDYYNARLKFFYASRRKLFAEHLVPTIYRETSKVVGNKYIILNKDGSVQKKLTLCEDILHPNYIQELFDKVFLPRICDKNGKKLSLKDACKNIRNLTICAHCHGAYTFLAIEKMMQQKMSVIGYTDEDRKEIQKELLCLACAPDTPLGISKSTMISFTSEQDPGILICNKLTRVIKEKCNKDNNFKPIYLPEKQGSVFVARKLFTSANADDDFEREHDFLSYKGQNDMTPVGKQFLTFLSNAIINSVKNAQAGGPLPPVKELVCGNSKENEALFDQMENDGQKIWNEVSPSAKAKAQIVSAIVQR